LARTTLKDDEIADTDEVARNRHSIWRVPTARLNEADFLADAFADAGGACFVTAHDDLLLAIMVMVMMVEGVEDAVGGALEAAAEAVIVAFVVVVAHVVSDCLVSSADLFFGDFDIFTGCLAAVFDFVGWVDAAAVVAFCDIDLRLVGSITDVPAVSLRVDFAFFGWAVVAEKFVSLRSLTFATEGMKDNAIDQKRKGVLPLTSELYLWIFAVSSLVAATNVSNVHKGGD
jgi:hypothetical protein